MSADPATITAIASVLSATASVSGAMSAGDSKAPAEPTLTTPNVMPAPDDEAAKKAKQRSAQALTQRRGRQSTILSDPASTDLLGA